MLLLIDQYLKKAGFIGVTHQVNPAGEFFIAFEHALAVCIQFYRIDNRIAFAKIMTQVDILILKGFERYVDLITRLGGHGQGTEEPGKKHYFFHNRWNPVKVSKITEPLKGTR